MSPGENLNDLVALVPIERLKALLDEELVRTVESVVGSPNVEQAVRDIFLKFLHDTPERYLPDQAVVSLLLSRMSLDKKRELERRLGMKASELIRENRLKQKETVAKLAGFFGIEQVGHAFFIEKPNAESVVPAFPLFPHQRTAADKVWKHVGQGASRVILHMPTGAGKTRTAMHTVARFLNLHEPSIVVWLASSAELLEQASDAFEEAWGSLGNREVSLRRAWGNKSIDLDGFEDGLLVGGLQKLHSFVSKNPIAAFRLGRRTQLVVMDEAHQAIAPTYRDVITNLVETGKHNALIGLSATPGRTWADVDEDAKLSNFFEHRKVTLSVPGYDNPVTYLLDNGYLARPEFRSLKSESKRDIPNEENSRESDYSDSVLEAIADDADRNALIIGEILRLVREGHRRIIFFSTSVSHAENVAALLEVIGTESQVVTGNTPQGQRRKAIKKYRSTSVSPIVMCNFGVLTTGFDAPETSAAVIARPTKSLVLYSQMVGRATRGTKAGGNENCVISTVVDTSLPGFGDIAEAFMNWEDIWSEQE